MPSNIKIIHTHVHARVKMPPALGARNGASTKITRDRQGEQMAGGPSPPKKPPPPQVEGWDTQDRVVCTHRPVAVQNPGCAHSRCPAHACWPCTTLPGHTHVVLHTPARAHACCSAHPACAHPSRCTRMLACTRCLCQVTCVCTRVFWCTRVSGTAPPRFAPGPSIPGKHPQALRGLRNGLLHVTHPVYKETNAKITYIYIYKILYSPVFPRAYRFTPTDTWRRNRAGRGGLEKPCINSAYFFSVLCGKKRSRYNKHPLRAGWTLLPEVWTVLPGDMDICRAANTAKNK